MGRQKNSFRAIIWLVWHGESENEEDIVIDENVGVFEVEGVVEIKKRKVTPGSVSMIVRVQY